MKIKYTGPCRDYSGYGEASRHDIAALVKAGVEVTTQIPVYCPELSDYGPLGDLALSLQGRELGYNVKILHTTPNVYGQYAEPNKYLIGRAFWETDKVPLDFALNLQKCHEIWTGSEYNKKAMHNAGVTRDIYIIPEAIDAKVTPDEFDPYLVENKDGYRFYSIFEWTERKNPTALLEAYWREFENTPDVSLTLKTYQISFGPDKREPIDQQIRKLKAKLNLKVYAPVFMYRNLMDRRQIYRFHRTFDCFVSAHRGEGWGIPQMEALTMAKPIISTNLGGIHEYLTDKKDALLIGYTMTPVDNKGYNEQWYTPDQNWANVDIAHLREAMRWVYENRDKAANMGKLARETAVKRFDLPIVGKIMADRLKLVNDKVLNI